MGRVVLQYEGGNLPSRLTELENNMNFIKLGNRGKIKNSRISGNIIVVDDASQVDAFISGGDDAEVTGSAIKGNEVHTPASYSLKIKEQRDKLFLELTKCQKAIDSIQDVFAKQQLEQALAAASAQNLTSEGERNFRQIISGVATLSKEVGIAVVAGAISKYLGS